MKCVPLRRAGDSGRLFIREGSNLGWPSAEGYGRNRDRLPAMRLSPDANGGAVADQGRHRLPRLWRVHYARRQSAERAAGLEATKSCYLTLRGGSRIIGLSRNLREFQFRTSPGVIAANFPQFVPCFLAFLQIGDAFHFWSEVFDDRVNSNFHCRHPLRVCDRQNRSPGLMGQPFAMILVTALAEHKLSCR
jgi:hypothetical protein